MQGEVIGINTAIVGRAYQGISFAIPSETAHHIYDQLRANRHVVRGYLGVQLAQDGEVTPQLARTGRDSQSRRAGQAGRRGGAGRPGRN